MSNALKKIGVAILFSFLILSFALWGVGDMFRGRGVSQTVATVGDTEVQRQEVNEQFRRVLNAMRARFGASFDREQAIQLGLLEQTLDQIINSRLLLLDANALGLHAGDALVRTAIQNAPQFHGLNNTFDPLRFREFLQREGFNSEAAYVALLRQDLMRSQITGALTAGIDPPKQLVETIYAFRNEQRVADVVSIPAGDPASLPDPDEATLAAFHKANPALFTAPEYRQLVVVYLNPADAAAEINVPEERLREEFEQRRAQLSVPERRELHQLLFQDEETARKVSGAIKEGRSFEKAAEDVAKTKPSSLGRLRKSDLPEALANVAFSLPQGAVSEPVKTPLGWHLVRVVSIEPGKEASFEEARKQIRDDLAREIAVDALARQSNQLDDALAGGASLEEAAAKANAKVIEIPAMDPRGMTPDGKPVPGIPRDPRFLATATSALQGEPTTIEETADGGYFVLRVDKITPPALKPLDQVRAQAVKAWKERQLRDKAKAKADAVREDAKTLGLAKAAEKHGLKLVTSKPFTRFGRESGSPVSDALAAELFRVKEGGIAVAEEDGGYAVGQVKQVIAAEPAKQPEAVKQIEDTLRARMADDLVQGYLAALKQRYEVKIDRETLDSLISGVTAGG